MPSIQIMVEELSNKIAAGEVVERPASVVKELVENAIDAGSSRIQVFVQEGGLEGIKIVDNGKGMDREDALLSFERHATSKLKETADLFRINTLGFRGEALPSLASVSHVSMQTWDGKSDTGTRLVLIGGDVQEVADAPTRQGTIIEIEQLFYNTPARYKYLKTVNTELSHITDFMNKLALAYPQIAFQLVHNEKELLRTTGNGQLLSVIQQIYGLSMAKKMIPFQAEHLDFQVVGYLGQAEISRSTRQHMTVMINGRYVKSMAVNQAILLAYKTRLPVHRYPIVILNIRMDPSILDVNVHPAKLEVRLSKEKELVDWLTLEMDKAFRQEQGIPKPLEEQGKKILTKQPFSPKMEQPAFALDLGVRKQRLDYPSSDQAVDQWLMEYAKQPSLKEKQPLVQKLPAFTAPIEQKKIVQEQLMEYQIPLLYPLGQLHGTYILAQNEEGLYMIDQHAAQERIWYEHFCQKIQEPPKASQELLIPMMLELANHEAEILLEQIAYLEELGIQVESFGSNTFKVSSHPQWFPQGEEHALIQEIIDFVILHKQQVEWLMLRDKAAALMACKQAIKANRYLTQGEMEALLEQLRQTSNPFTCPHGRPITILLSKYEIEKMFKRVM